jgi:hypothetical protein
VDLQELQVRRARGQGWRRIARAMRVPTTTLRRRWKECQGRAGQPEEPRQREVLHREQQLRPARRAVHRAGSAHLALPVTRPTRDWSRRPS